MTTADLTERDVMTVERLTKELRQQAREMRPDEARFAVDAYYQLQHFRIQTGNQLSAAVRGTDAPPLAICSWVHDHVAMLETRIRQILQRYAEGQVAGQWAMSQKGIGPVLAAGLLAHIDIQRAPTAGHIWNYAGLNPGVTWNKGEKRPWNARLKVLCWKIGESFVKVSGYDDAYYGKLYVQRKQQELDRNESGDLAAQAAAALEKKSFRRETTAKAAYEQGKLPPAHIHARACRWTTKLFLSHFHYVLFEDTFREAPPVPYAIAHLGHAHLLKPPGWPMSIDV